ncbi:hypothetical protein ACFVWN_07405 [Nocardiopsis flavescens]|uniref:hypothetical protein n=1 Tax=Nocardiopsis flavescens TaxID=758803 RepID=UPI00365B1E29
MITVHGGPPLHGTVAVEGSKNASLPLLAAAACVPQQVAITGLPGSADVLTMLSLLKSAGAEISLTPEAALIGAITEPVGDLADAAEIRASYYLIPAMLAAHGRARLPWPGGCSIGARGIELLFAVYEAFGDLVTQDEDGYEVTAGRRSDPVHVELPFPSRGATIAAVLRAVVSRRVLVLRNPNRTAETLTLVGALRHSGVQIDIHEGEMRVVPTGLLHTASWRVPGDKVEAGTLLSAIAITRGAATVTGVPAEHLAAYSKAMDTLGFAIELDGQTARLSASRPYRAGRLAAIGSLEPDGLDADFEPALLVTALSMGGTHRFGDSINPGRHGNLIPELTRFGARITELSPTLCEVTGPQRLHPTIASATDIRTGTALVLAALGTVGESNITGTDQIKRGHPDLVGALAVLGAKIQEEG